MNIIDHTMDDEVTELVLREHPEIGVLWERQDRITGSAEINGVNPVLHVLLEITIENQVRDDNPVEARLALERLQALGLSRHAARTVISSVLVDYIYKAQVDEKAFDSDDYAKALNLLGVSTKKVGRNERCPCGSGKKFKRCCLDRMGKVQALQRRIDFAAGVNERLLLGSGSYASQDYLDTLSSDDPLLLLENRAHVAHFLERQVDIEGAWLVLQENIELAVKVGEEGLINNAYLSALMVCENNPELAEDGLELIDDYIKYCDDDMTLQLLCDRADILAIVDGINEAEKEYQNLFSNYPEGYFAKYRYALLLLEMDREADALQVLSELKSMENKLDEFTLSAVEDVLADLMEE